MISKLHYITQDIAGFTHAELTESACKGGVSWVQLRLKNKPDAIWKQEALATLEVCRNYGAKLIINDNVALAKEIGADGVHLGRADMPVDKARTLLGADFIIGGTANTFSDIENLAKAGVDYIGLGPFRFTETKDNLSPVLGIEGYQQILKQCQEAGITIPIIAIGGLTLGDIKPLKMAGIYGIAVSASINKSADRAASSAAFLKLAND